MRVHNYKSEFVNVIPQHLKEGTLYVCLPYKIAMHKCACGCGAEVSTPISKKHGWVMSYDGEHVSMSPSIGNGAYACHSHYFLKNGRVEWLREIYNDYKVEQRPTKKREPWWKRLVNSSK